MEDNHELLLRQIYPKYLDYFQMRTNAFRIAIQTAINLHLTTAHFKKIAGWVFFE
jgi:hypothetical protein